jgi:hypothetical protein
MLVAHQDLDLDRLFVVAPVAQPYTLRAGIEVVSLEDAISGVARGR